jgi:hypothetical protein
MKRFDRAAAVFLALAVLWAFARFVSSFFVHVVERARPTGSAFVVPPTKTNFQAFDLSEVILTLLSLAAVLLVASTLSRRRSRGERGAGRLAWGVSIATVILGLVGGGSLFGVALFLLLACVAVPGRPSTGAGAGIDPWHSARGSDLGYHGRFRLRPTLRRRRAFATFSD